MTWRAAGWPAGGVPSAGRRQSVETSSVRTSQYPCDTSASAPNARCRYCRSAAFPGSTSRTLPSTNAPLAPDTPTCRPGPRPRRDTHGDLRRAVPIAQPGVRQRARGEARGDFGAGRRQSDLREHARVVPEHAHGGHAAIPVVRADGIMGVPPAPAHRDEIVSRPGNGVGTQGRQVLVGERIADQQVLAAVRAPAEAHRRQSGCRPACTSNARAVHGFTRT